MSAGGRWGVRGDYTKVKSIMLNGSRGNRYVFEKTRLTRGRGQNIETTLLGRITMSVAGGNFAVISFSMDDADVIINGLQQLMKEDKPR